MNLEEKVQSVLGQLEIGPRLIVGVSGGPDSLVLLHILKQLVPVEKLVAAHLNHCLRREGDDEAKEVARIAAAWGIDCYVERVDVAVLARESGISLEEAGRRARYEFFDRVAAEIGAKVVAVGHHAGDQVETILMHLLRGAGLSGLRGMQVVAPMPGSTERTLIRPLILVNREEIEAYCRQHGLGPRLDPTNQDTRFFRNRLRHELIPYLETYNPRISEGLLQLAELATADLALLEELTVQKWSDVAVSEQTGLVILNRTAWKAQPLSLRRSLIRRAAARLRPDAGDVGFRTIEEARILAETGGTGTKASLPSGIQMTIEYDHLNFAVRSAALPVDLPQLPGEGALALAVPGSVTLANGWTLVSTIVGKYDPGLTEQNHDPWTACVMTDAQTLQIRPRRPGERFQPMGMAGHSARVKEVMINRKIPGRLRDRWPLVCDDDHIIWIVGHQIDERSRVTGKPQSVVILHCLPPPG